MAALAQDGVKICRSTLNRAKQVANGADGVFVYGVVPVVKRVD